MSAGLASSRHANPAREAGEERQHLIACAQAWVGTPYHTAARLRGVGADCITWIAGAFEDAGLVPHIAIPFYPLDWNLHRVEERYLSGLREWCVEVPAPPERVPLPGDIVLWKIGRCFAHGALVVAWPRILHANIGRKLGYDNVDQVAALNFIGGNVPDRGKPRPRKFFCFKAWAEP